MVGYGSAIQRKRSAGFCSALKSALQRCILHPAAGIAVLASVTSAGAYGQTPLPGAQPHSAANLGVGAPVGAPGQSVTQLPDGRWLLVGGRPNGSATSSISLLDQDQPNSAALPMAVSLAHARTAHSSTVLPDGTVLVVGGVGPDGNVVDAAELFDPRTATVTQIPDTGLLQRTGHTATLLTDGSILVAGGKGKDGRLIQEAELLDSGKLRAQLLVAPLLVARTDHAAALLANGKGYVQGGLDSNGRVVVSAEIFDPERTAFEAVTSNDKGQLATSAVSASPSISGVLPRDGATNVPLDTRVALRFQDPVDVRSVNGETVSLVGPFGAVAGLAIAAEAGRLAFFTPEIELLPATTYTVLLSGVTDHLGRPLPFSSYKFTTKRIQPGSDGTNSNSTRSANGSRAEGISALDGISGGRHRQGSASGISGRDDSNAHEESDFEDWIPKEPNRHGSWRVLGLEKDPRLTLAHVSEIGNRVGLNGVSGRVVRLNGRPIAGVTVSAGRVATVTDPQGRFLISGIPTGKQQLLIDGTAVWSNGRHYTKHVLQVDVADSTVTRLPGPVFLPRVDPASEVAISSPADKEIVLTHPDIPGLEVRIPKGTILREYDGKIVTKLSITPVPVDRAPYATPTNFSVYFTLQPGGAFVDGDPSKAIRIVYPNYQNLAPGTMVDFWNYDPNGGGWKVYGQGIVSADGKKVVADQSLGFRQIMTFGYALGDGGALAPPAKAPAPGSECPSQVAADPVDCGTGLFLHRGTDLAVDDVLPVAVSRTYRTNDSAVRAFGIGTSFPYSMYLYATTNTSAPPNEVYLVQPDGARITFTLQSGGSSLYTAIWKHTSSPSAFLGATLKLDSPTNRFVVTMLDGTKLGFHGHKPNDLLEIVDRHGNAVSVNRASGTSGNITQITSPNGRYIRFTYEATRIKSATDMLGRTVTYDYDASGRLIKVTDPEGKSESYTYDAAHRMLTVTDKRGNRMLLNEYYTDGRVKTQTLADGALWQFSYTIDANDKITQTNITDPRGYVRRDKFNASGYITEKTLALGQTVQQIYAYERNASNQVSTVTDPLNRKTRFTFDSFGNIKTVTRLADTADAVSESYTYEPTYQQIKTYTDPLAHTTTFAYDSAGQLASVTDALGHTVKFTYEGQGLLKSVTDALNHSVTMDYFGADLATVTDALGRVFTMFTDNAGRPISVMDPLGNRTRYDYDALNRTLAVTDAIGGLTKLEHDANGNLISVTDPRDVGSHSFTYNLRNWKETYTDPLGKTERHEYDGLGNLKVFTDRKGQVTRYDYDPLNRLQKITFNGGSTVTMTWDAGNRLNTVVDSAYGTVTWDFDLLDRLKKETTAQGQVAYDYDAAGRRKTMTVGTTTPITYDYDNADRLKSITQGTAIVGFTYDDADRRKTLTLPNGVVTTYGYNDADELTSLAYAKGSTSLGGVTYGYDVAGRRIQRLSTIDKSGLPASIGTAADARTYNWNDRNQLASISGGASATFTYDPMGRRAQRTVGSTSTRFLYDGMNVAQDLNGSTVVANYLTGLGIDEVFSRTAGGSTQSYLTDALGSTVALADSAGSVATSYAYDPYGNTTSTGAASSNTIQYTGRENDGTGLYDYRARYYSPQFHRFISSDPIGLSGGINTYAYVGGNPIFYRDPTGHLAILAVPYAPAIVGAVAAGMAAITVAWASIHDFDDDEEEYVPKPKPRPKPQPKPKNCPAGTKPIDQMGWSKDKVHGIKDGLGLGATDWTGVAPDGSIVVTGPNGDAVTAGHESDY